MDGSNYELHCADCLAVLPTMEAGSVDAVITSPPYNTMGTRIPARPTGMHKGNGFFSSVTTTGYADDMPEDAYQSWCADVVRGCMAACNGTVWINHKTRYRDGVAIHPLSFLKFPLWAEIIWDRRGSMVLNANRFAPSHESIYGFGIPSWWDKASNTKMSVWRIAPRRDDGTDGHPCPFPIEIANRLINASCPPNGIVLDPFMGSGTTGVAAMLTGRKFIGIELDPGYFAIAEARIRKAAQQAAGEFVTINGAAGDLDGLPLFGQSDG